MVNFVLLFWRFQSTLIGSIILFRSVSQKNSTVVYAGRVSYSTQSPWELKREGERDLCPKSFQVHTPNNLTSSNQTPYLKCPTTSQQLHTLMTKHLAYGHLENIEDPYHNSILTSKLILSEMYNFYFRKPKILLYIIFFLLTYYFQ